MPEEVVVSEGRKIVVQISTYEGREALDIRTWIESPKYSGPTKKGVNIPVEKGEELAEKILKVLKEVG